MAKGCSETCIYCRCLSLRNKDTNGREEKKRRALCFLRGHKKTPGGWSGGDLMEMVQITHKKMIWKKGESRRIFFFMTTKKRAKIKIEKIVGWSWWWCHFALLSLLWLGCLFVVSRISCSNGDKRFEEKLWAFLICWLYVIKRHKTKFGILIDTDRK